MAEPKCKSLVLDAGPLLSLSPLRGLASTYYTTPQVLAELKDVRARDHFEKLGLLSGVNVVVKSPDAASLSHVIQWAKKTGDYSVLSHADMCVIALTYMLSEEYAREQMSNLIQTVETMVIDASTVVPGEATGTVGEEQHPIQDHDQHASPHPIYADPADEDDGEGEWITPQNAGIHKSRALDLLPDNEARGQDEKIGAGCMTADFAMQNVLLQMHLDLVSVDGRRIQQVRNYVLRCHACFKICKDHSKQFCPSCGNPSLLRATATVSAPNAAGDAPVLQVHLKPNFQYRIRGTKYPIPAPTPGSAKKGPGEGLILREDQAEYVRAKKRADSKRQKEETRMLKASSWMDPDWVPEMVSVGAGGTGRTVRASGMDGDMPVIGYGRRNPNENK